MREDKGVLPGSERQYSAAGLSLEASRGQTQLCFRGTWERKVSWLSFFTPLSCMSSTLERILLASLC